MKITRTLANKLLVESPSFRDFVLNAIYPNVKNNLEKIVFDASNKIEAIKAIREYCAKNPDECKEAFPLENFYVVGDATVFGLASAKRIVEGIRTF